MGRPAEGYKLRLKGGTWFVRFTVDGTRYDRTTGEQDRAAAEGKARAIYAAVLDGRNPRAVVGGVVLTPEGVGAWLDDLALRPSTLALYEKYTVYWLRHLRTLDEQAIAAYTRRRLREVRGKTVRHELSALRGLLRWLVAQGDLPEAPEVPRLSTADIGRPYSERRRSRASDYTPAEIRKLLERLPEKAPTGFWVRPRCELLYETGLRPATVDALRVPDHYERGSPHLLVTLDIDKEGFAREVPLSKQARAILRRVAKEPGLVFGEHRYTNYLTEHVRAALAPGRREAFTFQHLRSARATHWLDEGMALTSAAYLLGHRDVATTALYLRPGKRQAERDLRRIG